MKWMIASDIHGSEKFCSMLLEQYNKIGCDKLILLGDVLYHGPRNDLPEGYNPKGVIELLNPLADKIICLRGNCEAEVDQMVLKFPILSPYVVFVVNNKTIVFTHGHIYNSNNLPLKDIILVHGHTHVTKCEVNSDHVYLNPGSVSIPKENTPRGFMVMEDDTFTFYDLEGIITNTYRMN